MSTYLELVQDLHSECNVGGTAPTSGNFTSLTGTAAKLKTWVKQADLELKSKWFNWKFLWASGTTSVISGTSDYAAPTGLGMYDKGTFQLDGDPIDVIEYREFKETYFHATNTPGTPTKVVILPDNRLRLWPEPNASFTLSYEYYKAANASSMSAHGDSSVIPSAFHQAIYYLAMLYYAKWDNAPELESHAMSALYGRDGSKEGGWIAKLEAHQLPNSGYGNAVSDGNYEIQVIPE